MRAMVRPGGQRVLVEAFDESPDGSVAAPIQSCGRRVLRGCYVSTDDVVSRRRVLRRSISD